MAMRSLRCCQTLGLIATDDLCHNSEVYGDPLQHPQTEEYWGNVNPIGERACYDEGKRVAETLAFDYYRSNNVEVRVVRIFNTYGMSYPSLFAFLCIYS